MRVRVLVHACTQTYAISPEIIAHDFSALRLLYFVAPPFNLSLSSGPHFRLLPARLGINAERTLWKGTKAERRADTTPQRPDLLAAVARGEQ